MTMENKLQQSLLEKSKEVLPPPDLKQKVMNKIDSNAGKSKMKKRLAAGIIAASILIPTSAIAVEGYLADDLYGSFQNLKKHIATATMDGYMRLNTKLYQAKGELSQEEYEKFTKQLKVLSAARLEYGDQDGHINYDAIPEAEAENIKLALKEVQPYFDQMNTVSPGTIPAPKFKADSEHVQIEYVTATIHDGHVSAKDIILFTDILKQFEPFEAQAGSNMDVSFEKQPDTLELQIWKNDELISSKNIPDGNFAFPNQTGDYTFVLIGQWDQSVVPYVFAAEITN